MMEPQRKAWLRLLLLLLLGFSCLLPLGAVPASRSFPSRTQELNYPKLKQEPPVLSITKQGAFEELVRGRMDMENFNDYPGTGPNNRHDPKTPGRA